MDQLASTIQKARYLNQNAPPCMAQFYALPQNMNMVLQITFNHINYNGLDVVKVYQKNKAEILKHFQLNEEVFVVDNDRFYVSKVKELPNRDYHYIGSPNITAKEVIESFYNVWHQQFAVPVDMSHLTGSPCLLFCFVDKKLSFEENWNHIRKIKKNENNFLFDKDEQGEPIWKRYTYWVKAWVSIMHNPNQQSSLCFGNYINENVKLQAIVINIDKKDSRWAFSFNAKPQLLGQFVLKYNLHKV